MVFQVIYFLAFLQGQSCVWAWPPVPEWHRDPDVASLRLPAGSGPGALNPRGDGRELGWLGLAVGRLEGGGRLTPAPNHGTGRDGGDGQGQTHLGSDR